MSTSYDLELLGDTAAGRCLGSAEAFTRQGVPPSIVKKLARQTQDPLVFDTGGGEKPCAKTIAAESAEFGTSNFYLLEQCPLALSIGQQVLERERAFIWQHTELPYLVKDHTKLKILCPQDNKIYATRVSENVPVFNCNFTLAPGMTASVNPGGPAQSSGRQQQLPVIAAEDDGTDEYSLT